VLPIGPGVKEHPLFFLTPRFWFGARTSGARTAKISSTNAPGGSAVELTSVARAAEPSEPADVQSERERVLSHQVGAAPPYHPVPSPHHPSVT